jgi:mannosyltransferase OCH1-like enzyme
MTERKYKSGLRVLPKPIEWIRYYANGIGRKCYRLIAPKESDISHLYTSVPRNAKRIPNVVYQTWKNTQLPSLHALGVKRFRKLNADYSFAFFDDQAMNEYMVNNYCGYPILEVFQAIQVPAARADIWRYCILYREGGIYCDIDSALSMPFRELLSEDTSEMLSFEGNRWSSYLEVGQYSDPNIFLTDPPLLAQKNLDFPDYVILNWLLCFEKGHPILEEVINLIVQHFGFFKNREFPSMHQTVVHCTGPLALTQAVWKWVQKTNRRPSQFGIDFNGYGIFKLSDSDKRYTISPHYSSYSNTCITRP